MVLNLRITTIPVSNIIQVLGGFTKIVIQKIFGFVMITTSLSYPVSLKLTDVLLVFTTITILGLLASKIASTRISKPLLNQ